MVIAEQKIRIAIIVPRLEALGPVIVIQNLVNSISDNDSFSIKVFYLDSKVDNKILMSVPVERLNHKKFLFTDYDIIHTNGIRPDLFGYMNRKKIKYHISTIHNFVFEDLSFTYNKLISWIFGNFWLIIWNRADKLVCVSAALEAYYAKWFPIEKLTVVHNGIVENNKSLSCDEEISFFIDKFHSEGLTVIGFVGILTKRKGVDQVMHLLSSKKELAFVIIGDGKAMADLIGFSEKLKVSERCLFCGFRENAVSYFRYFDLFIMPSRSEGFGLSLIEAVQQKVPVICSDILVFKELFTEDEVTFYKSGDLTSLIDALNKAKETGKWKLNSAYSRYMNNYTSVLMAKNYYDLYRSA